jgi:hypothetical protein
LNAQARRLGALGERSTFVHCYGRTEFQRDSGSEGVMVSGQLEHRRGSSSTPVRVRRSPRVAVARPPAPRARPTSTPVTVVVANTVTAAAAGCHPSRRRPSRPLRRPGRVGDLRQVIPHPEIEHGPGPCDRELLNLTRGTLAVPSERFTCQPRSLGSPGPKAQVLLSRWLLYHVRAVKPVFIFLLLLH